MTKRWLAPAKLNLFLHITGQRQDGYHNLQTVFHFLNYCDELSFELRNDDKIELANSLPGVNDNENLVYKAAKALQIKASDRDHSLGVTIHLNKKLPMGGGLGGGSSNAATTLVALNNLWQLNLPATELKEIGLNLGADVPVFIHGQTCFAEGVGDKFSDMDVEERWFLVIIPDCHVNTGEIFSNRALTRNSKTIRIRAPLTWQELGELKNDCEPVVRKLYPDVNQALEWLSQYGDAKMTGTGCCVFSHFPSEQEASKIANRLPEGIRAFIAKGLNKSPMRPC